MLARPANDADEAAIEHSAIDDRVELTPDEARQTKRGR